VGDLELWLVALTALGVVIGTSGIFLARASESAMRVAIGRGLFVFTLFFFGVCSSVAAFHHAHGLAPMGLAAGGLVVGMLWETPQRSGLAIPEEA
jgi:hypothetical protein